MSSYVAVIFISTSNDLSPRSSNLLISFEGMSAKTVLFASFICSIDRSLSDTTIHRRVQIQHRPAL